MQRNRRFYPGQTVMLSSGGPHMTVKPAEDDHDGICCVWFNAALGGEPIEWIFQRSVLTFVAGDSYGHVEHAWFEAGQVVQLRSGGPVMTVVDVSRTDGAFHVSCLWLDEKNREPLSASFSSKMLVAITADGTL